MAKTADVITLANDDPTTFTVRACEEFSIIVDSGSANGMYVGSSVVHAAAEPALLMPGEAYDFMHHGQPATITVTAAGASGASGRWSISG